MAYRTNCRSCGRFFFSERRFRKYCSSYCYSVNRRTRQKIGEATTLAQRKVEMAMGLYHEEQLTQLVYALNSVKKMALVEKRAIILGAIRQNKEVMRELVSRVKGASKEEMREVNRWIARVPGEPKKVRKGPYWCRSCGANMVPGPFMDCQKCIDSRYTAQDHEDAMEPFERRRDETKV